jgi:hypothetical protein
MNPAVILVAIITYVSAAINVMNGFPYIPTSHDERDL